MLNYTALAGALVARLENMYAIYRIQSQKDIDAQTKAQGTMWQTKTYRQQRGGGETLTFINISIHYRLRQHSLFSDGNSK